MRIASLDIQKEEFSFSAGHFTIFSATDREALHGHNYYVSLHFECLIEENGLSFDYRYYKKQMKTLCEQLDRHFLLPSESPYLKLEDGQDYWYAHFNGQKIPFLKQDVRILPLSNITIEELSNWFLQQLLSDKTNLALHKIKKVSVNVFNGPGQSGGASWQANQ